MSVWPLDLGDGCEIVIRDAQSDQEIYELTRGNLERLRRWEGWAQGELTKESIVAYRVHQAQAWEARTAIPGLIRLNERLIGSISAQINPAAKTAEIGFWIDKDHEGQGIVTKAVRGLVDLVFTEFDMARIEIRASVANERSRAVAERCGFSFHGVVAQALTVGPDHHDAAVYELTRSVWAGWPAHRGERAQSLQNDIMYIIGQ